MKINEIFQGIQGEGKYTGTNVIFIRLSGCSLRCKWCDSSYHWTGEEMHISEILKIVKGYNTKKIVITGGEPLLQQKNLVKLLNELEGYHITIETNGTIMPIEAMLNRIDHWSCSPKLASSGNLITDRIKGDALHALNKVNDSVFKFVISSDEDIDEMEAIIDNIKIDKDKVYLMKEGATSKDQYKELDKFVDKCCKLGYNFSPRIHIMIFDILRKK
jgi:7-carboxy-7-deazaguanine synthase